LNLRAVRSGHRIHGNGGCDKGGDGSSQGAITSQTQFVRGFCELYRCGKQRSFFFAAELSLAPDADEAKVQLKFSSGWKNTDSLIQQLHAGRDDGAAKSGWNIVHPRRDIRRPALECGFVDRLKLDTAALREEILLSQVITSYGHEGVQAIKDIVVNPASAAIPLENKWKVPVAPGKKGDAHGNFAVLFFKRNMPVKPAAGQVDDRYNELLRQPEGK